jgi:hypothetical protein
MKRSVTQLVARRCSNKKDLLRHPTTSSAALRRQGGGVLSTAASHFSSLAMSGPLKMHSAYSCLMTNGPRMLYSSLPDDPSQYYTIEASNADREDATKLTVRGPDVDGTYTAAIEYKLGMKNCKKMVSQLFVSLLLLRNSCLDDCSFGHEWMQPRRIACSNGS